MAAAGALGLGGRQQPVAMGGAEVPTVMGSVAVDQGQQVTPVPTVGHTMGAVAVPMMGKPKIEPKTKAPSPKPGEKPEPKAMLGELGL
jgi:hypothetical protein